MDTYEKKTAAIRKLMEYTVPDSASDSAMDLLDMYRDDRLALDVLHEFYSSLPDPEQPFVRELRLIGRSRGVFLLVAVTEGDGFAYLVSGEGIEFQGSLREGLHDPALLDFFGMDSGEDLAREPEDLQSYPEYEPLSLDSGICPSCHVASGELHELGCPVEVCPWCGGQLVRCGCRFDKLGLDFIKTEADLHRLEALLESQGRIAYAPEQRPAFLDLPEDGEDFL